MSITGPASASELITAIDPADIPPEGWTTETVARYLAGVQAKHRHEIHETLWDEKNDRMRKLRRLKFESANAVFGQENLWGAFAPLHGEVFDVDGGLIAGADTVYVGCPDDRCAAEKDGRTIHRFCIPGTGVLRPELDSAELRMQLLWAYQERGIKVVPTYHDHCGACAVAAKSAGKDPVALAKEVSSKLAGWLGETEEPTRMGYDDGSEEVARLKEAGKFIEMRGVPEHHDGRVMVIDLSNRCYRSARLGLRPSMKLNRYDDDPQVLLNDVELLLSIMMDPSAAPGHAKFKDDKYLVVVIGMTRPEGESRKGGEVTRPEFAHATFRQAVEKHIAERTPWADAVDVVSFEAPPASDCVAYQDGLWMNENHWPADVGEVLEAPDARNEGN